MGGRRRKAQMVGGEKLGKRRVGVVVVDRVEGRGKAMGVFPGM